MTEKEDPPHTEFQRGQLIRDFVIGDRICRERHRKSAANHTKCENSCKRFHSAPPGYDVSPAILEAFEEYWHLGGSEDPWLCGPGFHRVCFIVIVILATPYSLDTVRQSGAGGIFLIVNLIQGVRNVRFGSLADLLDSV